MMNTLVAITALLVRVAIASPLLTRSVDFDWGSTPVKGVNIGGWLVLEPWITPKIFNRYDDVIDEYTLCKNHPQDAPGILEDHWESFLKKDELQTIFDAGFNVVRIPIGYWAFEKDAPFVQGAADHLDEAIRWAGDIGLKVVVDLHGAPESQNGYDNSGRRGTAGWTSGDTIERTRKVVSQIAKRYATSKQQEVVVGIELLNEPNPDKLPDGGLEKTVQFYKDAFGDVRKVSDTPVLLSDAFQEQGSFWNDILPTSSANNVIIDHHEYQIFTDELINLSFEEHIDQICSRAQSYSANVEHWVIVGEWSAALTDCAGALNGWKIGSRWEGYYTDSKGPTGRSCGNINFDSEWTSNQTLRDQTEKYIKAQLDTYLQRTKGFFFWNLKTEQSPEWDLLRLLQWGLFPKLTNYQPSGSGCS